MDVGTKQSMWIDIDKADVREIARLLEELTDEEHTFAQLRIEVSGMEHDRSITSKVLHVYGEDKDGNDVDVNVTL